MRDMSSGEWIPFAQASDVVEFNMFRKKVGHPTEAPRNQETNDYPQMFDDEYWEKLEKEYEMFEFGRIATQSDAMDSQVDFLMTIQNT